MGILNLGAGLAAFVGPGIFTALNPFVGRAGVVIVYSVLYLISAVLTWVFLRDENDPAERRKRVASGTLAESGVGGA